jgi:excisionase family DNA binding protein
MQKQTLPAEQRGALNVHDAAAYLSVGISSLYKLLKQGKLRDVQIAGPRVFLREDLDSLLHGEASK